MVCLLATPTDNEEFTLLLVFRYLSIPELFRVGGVCKKWREVSRHPSLWKEVQFHDLMLTPEVSATTGCRGD